MILKDRNKSVPYKEGGEECLTGAGRICMFQCGISESIRGKPIVARKLGFQGSHNGSHFHSFSSRSSLTPSLNYLLNNKLALAS